MTHAARVWVVDTETRHLSPRDAGARISRWANASGKALFKKTDSTLRGNISAELLALLPLGPVVYIPAYPALGRTVRNGELRVHGVPVSETEFARDVRHPVRSARIADLFPPDVTQNLLNADELQRALEKRTPKVLICDAATDEEITRLAAVLLSQAVTLAGPSRIVETWAGLHRFPLTAAQPVPAIEKWLVVCGSLHPQSRRQAAWAKAQGFSVLASPAEARGSPEAAAAELATQATAWIHRQRPQGVIIMGGDTAWALWRALGVDTLEPLPEVLPGVAVSRSRQPELLFVTKAGGFGEEHFVEQVRVSFS